MSADHSAQTAFSTRIEGLLDGRDSVVTAASALTDFAWDKLCFERDDALLLKFTGAQAQTLKLRYEDFFVDEPYVENSLADQCVKPGDKVLVKRKYPGYSATVEFQQAK